MSNPPKLLTADDLHLFNEGRHFRIYEKFGAQLTQENSRGGVRFTVWAPAAESVSLIGDFNDWQKGREFLEPVGSSGLWSGFVNGVAKGARYKYHIRSRHSGYEVDKADPVGFLCEKAPRTASVVWDQDYRWGDETWMRERAQKQALDRAFAIYELHVGSWARKANEDNRPLSYKELAQALPSYVKEQGFTHVEFMPLMEHPFYGSWGYQSTGYFAPSSRYGSPQDLMALIDALHQAGLGVIFDWVPSHFWPRCFISITRAKRASGFRTNTGAAKTSRPSPF
jgi:1,4-alpha-glucan branching enzyme